MRKLRLAALLVLVSLGLEEGVRADDPKPADLSTRKEDVVYGHKFGMALTMDVFTPRKEANGAAVIFVVSGGWVSDRQALNNPAVGLFLTEPLKRGYTVFAVTHGSQPRYIVPEAVADLNRAVRFIRSHAKDYQIDPDDYTAVTRLRTRNPAADVWLMRAGYPTTYRIGPFR